MRQTFTHLIFESSSCSFEMWGKSLLLGLVVAGSIAKYLLAERGYAELSKEVVE